MIIKDMLLISETKLNNTFPDNLFLMNGFHPLYQEDHTDKGGGLLLSVCKHIPSRKLIVNFSPITEAMFIEINLNNKRWLIFCSYNPHKFMIQNHLNIISKQFDELCKTYENFILTGDLNPELCEDAMSEFCFTNNLKNLGNKPTCF